MTKKDYEAVASIFRNCGDVREGSEANHIATFIANYMAADNPRFDRARFLAACRGEKWTKKRDGKHQNSWQSGMVHGEASR